MAIITISRQIAALGDEVAAQVATKLDYKFFGKEKIEQRIVELGFPKEKLEKYDERKPSFFASLASDRDEYLDYLQTAILEASSDNNCVLIGRGAFAILEPLPNLMAFRLIADDEIRLNRIKNEFSFDDKQAKQRIVESDTNRQGFHKSFFNIDNKDKRLFHAVLNTGWLDIETASDMIVQAVKSYVTPQKEKDGIKKVREMLVAQDLVNKLVFNYKININFLRAEVDEYSVKLFGVADSNSVVEKTLALASKELPDYKVESAISVVQDFKAARPQ
jgi:cytidylate kinase